MRDLFRRLQHVFDMLLAFAKELVPRFIIDTSTRIGKWIFEFGARISIAPSDDTPIMMKRVVG